jgi:nitrate reductase NapE component
MIMIIVVRDVRGTHHNVTFQNSSFDNKKTEWCKFVIVINVLFSICSVTERYHSV